MAGLLDWVTEKAKNQYQQGLLNQVINDPASVGREIGQLFDPAYMSQVKPMTKEGALDVALSAPMMAGTIKNINSLGELNTLNPTGGLYVDYTPQVRATQPIGKNLVSIDKTMGGSPDDIITIYRGAPKKQKNIVPGDFVSDMKELAQSYTGDGNVLALKVRKGDILDDINESLGNEYIYRPNADKYQYGLLNEVKKTKK